MNEPNYHELVRERLSGFVKKDRIKPVMTRLEPLIVEYHELRAQNAALLRVLRAQSGGIAPLESLLPADDPR